ncbi:MAG TPA: AraC family transcriptional regulator [Anaeromyxobacteraceae bacterium]|nr:AraC family transcriptional regulator [Anaeromyxobacteraceae bacterium]
MGARVLPVASRALVESCRRLGLDADALLRRAGVGPAGLADPDARIEAEQADALWREAYAAAGDPCLALHAAEATPFGAFPALDYLAASSATLGEGLSRVAAYFPLVDPRGRIDVRPGPGAVALVFRAAGGRALPPPAQEYTLAVLCGRGRQAASAPWRPAEVRFAFPRPAGAAEHARVFEVEPVFEAKEAALVLPRAAWESPTRAPDPGLSSLLDGHARRLADAAAAEGLPERVRAAVEADLPGREPSLAAVARRLGQSRRSLQRRLEASGTSFAKLVSAVRRERAEALLGSRGVSVAEVSFLLGFSEQSAFTRAFRRWTGRSPSEHRRAADTSRGT